MTFSCQLGGPRDGPQIAQGPGCHVRRFAPVRHLPPRRPMTTKRILACCTTKTLQFCVTPRDSSGVTGSQVCSGFTKVGHLVDLWDQDSYMGNSIHLPYELAGDGFCWNLSNYGFDDVTASAILHPLSNISG